MNDLVERLEALIHRREQIAIDLSGGGDTPAVGTETLRECLTALRALRDAPEWLPIESAPKDEPILIGPTKRLGICVAMLHSRDGWVTETPSEWVTIYTPTHWQPLPEAP